MAIKRQNRNGLDALHQMSEHFTVSKGREREREKKKDDDLKAALEYTFFCKSMNTL